MTEYAFPISTIDNHTEFGITIRDYFAAKALSNIYCAHESLPDKIAEWSYQVADAMLTERAKS